MKTPRCLPIKINMKSIDSVLKSMYIFNASGVGGIETALGCRGIACQDCIASISSSISGSDCMLQDHKAVQRTERLQWLLDNPTLWEEI